MAYVDKLCSEKHEKIKETLNIHDNRLTRHSDEIHRLRQTSASRTTEVTSMCRSLDSLNKRIDKIIEQNRNLLVTVITILIGFFLTMIQRGIFK